MRKLTKPQQTAIAKWYEPLLVELTDVSIWQLRSDLKDKALPLELDLFRDLVTAEIDARMSAAKPTTLIREEFTIEKAAQINADAGW